MYLVKKESRWLWPDVVPGGVKHKVTSVLFFFCIVIEMPKLIKIENICLYHYSNCLEQFLRQFRVTGVATREVIINGFSRVGSR